MDYFQIPAINWSTLKYMRDSPAAYLRAITEHRQDTPALAFGRLVHGMVLEPDDATRRYVIWSGGRRYGKAWDEFCDANIDREIVTAEDYVAAEEIASAVMENDVAMSLLRGARTEVVAQWQDPTTGLSCKAKIDAISKCGSLVDLKTTRSTDSRRFGAEAARYLYVHQLAHYANAMAHGLLLEPTRCVLIAVEKTPPYDVGVFEVDEHAMQIAHAEVSELLCRVLECRESGLWPGRYESIQPLNLPAYVYADDEEDAEAFDLVVS